MVRFRNGLLLGCMSGAGEPAGGGGSGGNGGAAGGQPGAAGSPPARDQAQDLADARAEAASRRIEARDATERLNAVSTEYQQFKETEPARLAAATAPLEQSVARAGSRVVDAELRAAAIGAGLVDGDLIPLIDRTGVAYDPATGNVTGINEAITKFKAAKPQFFGERGGGGGGGGGARSGASGSGREPAQGGGGPEPRDVRGLAKKDYEAAKKDALRGLH